ncbi:hypothetical protein ACPCUV_26565 [Streptomyces platensis]|uniref:hypothetical protein n=1 Tax=Streptomyces platensis TaxID=58346 RepID=UPI003C2F64C6
MTTVATRDSIYDTEFVSGFCRTTLPELVAQAGLTDDEARTVVVDVIRRARMLAALPSEYTDVLAIPFLEEVSQHRPSPVCAGVASGCSRRHRPQQQARRLPRLGRPRQGRRYHGHH